MSLMSTIDKRTVIDILLETIYQVREDKKSYYRGFLKTTVLISEGRFNILINPTI